MVTNVSIPYLHAGNLNAKVNTAQLMSGRKSHFTIQSYTASRQNLKYKVI